MEKAVRIFTTKQVSPCKPKSSCCRSIGPSAEEITGIKIGIEKLNCNVEILYIEEKEVIQKHPGILKLLQKFGHKIVPIIVIDDYVACIGSINIPEIISAIKIKL